MESYEQLLAQTSVARDQAWARFGKLDGAPLSQRKNPAFAGGPRWPGPRQAYKVARGGRGVLVASDGLADPYLDRSERRNGRELEFYAVTPDPLGRLLGSWLFDLVRELSDFAAQHAGVRALLDEQDVMSTELDNVSIPDAARSRFVNEHGRVGVMLGMPDAEIPARVDGPLSSIRLVSVTLLTAREIEHCASYGASGRVAIACRLAVRGDATVSSLRRKPVF